MKLPIVVNTTAKRLNGYAGFSFFIWIFIAEETRDHEKTINHEKIHFYQQLEMLFLPMWILYISYLVIGYFKYKNWYKSYKNIPFEREAYANDKNFDYLKTRRFWIWLKYL